MTISLPASLVDSDTARALRLLRSYYGHPIAGPASRSGASFDTWDSTGTRDRDRDVFTADDLVAVSLLSVDVPGLAARRLLVEEKDRYNAMLAAVGSDRDLATVEHLADDGPEWALDQALLELPGVGPTTASKLYARKRPRLRPIYDTVVAEVLGTVKHHWEPLRQALQPANGDLHERLLRLRDQAGLPEAVSALRVLDVVVWMEGKHAQQVDVRTTSVVQADRP